MRITGNLKINSAKEILLKKMPDEISSFELHDILPRFKLELRQGYFLFIRYNDFNEYSYQLIFSTHKNDRIRFDNYDELWNVKTKPNHFHPRFYKEGFESPMIGDPEKDIPILINLIDKGLLLNEKHRFL